MANTDNKTWTQPKIKVLQRGTPEENVLTSCKIAGSAGPGVDNCQPDKGSPCQETTTS